MNRLTSEQIEFISELVNASNITSKEMKEDLIDHLCCAIEDEMQRGVDFKTAYDKAYHNISPEGFDEIQRETIFLLTSKKIKKMKQLLYVSGYLSAIGLSAVMIMKLMHIPYAMLVLFFTLCVFILFFVPVLFVYLYRKDLAKSKPDKLRYILSFLAVMLLIIGLTFKLYHWPGTAVLLVSSVVLINFIVFPHYLLKMYRKTNTQVETE